MNPDFISQLNKTDQALQKYRRAASNYRENAYRIKVMDGMDMHDPEQYNGSNRRPENRYGSGGFESRSLPRQGNTYGVGVIGEVDKKLTTIEVNNQ